MEPPFSFIASDVELAPTVTIKGFVNLYGCRIGDETSIGPFVEIQRDVVIGERCKIQSHAFICSGVTIEDDVFVGHGVIFVNDKHPLAVNERGERIGPDDWELRPTSVGRGASLGSGAIILGGLRVGGGALVGAGAVVTEDVPDGATVAGIPARNVR